MKDCWWIFNHQYTNWEDIEKGQVNLYDHRRPGGNPVSTGNYVVQERYCEKCNRKRLRTVKTNL